MDCRSCQETIDESPVASRDALPEEAKAHLAQCNACRKYAQAAETLALCLASIEKTASEIPDAWLTETKRAVMSGVWERGWAPVPRRTASDLLALPGWAWGMAAAVLVLLAYGGAIIFAERRDARLSRQEEQLRLMALHAIERTVPRPVAKVVQPAPELASAPEAAPEVPPATLASLREEFERLKASDAGVDREFLARLRKFIANGVTGLDEQVAATSLLVAACEQLGERDLARAAFEKYLDHVEQRYGAPRAAEETRGMARRLFFEQRDRLGALAYCDMLLARYPESQFADSMRFLTCRYYELEGLPEQALAAYRGLRETGGEYYAWEADRGVSQILYNTGRKEEAFAEVDGMIARHPEKRAYLYFHKGMILKAAGARHYPAAIQAFKMVVEKYPETHYAGNARNKIAAINKQMMEGMARDML